MWRWLFSVLTCYPQIHDGLLIGVTVFKERVVLPPIKNTDCGSWGSLCPLPACPSEALCDSYSCSAFSREFFPILVQVNQTGRVLVKPHCGRDSWQQSSALLPARTTWWLLELLTVKCSAEEVRDRIYSEGHRRMHHLGPSALDTWVFFLILDAKSFLTSELCSQRYLCSDSSAFLSDPPITASFLPLRSQLKCQLLREKFYHHPLNISRNHIFSSTYHYLILLIPVFIFSHNQLICKPHNNRVSIFLKNSLYYPQSIKHCLNVVGTP